MKITGGVTRLVLLTRRYAFKVPQPASWRQFLLGLLANMQEVRFSGISVLLCPVIFSLPGGLLVVMPRAEPVDEVEFNGWELLELANLPTDPNPLNFGRLNGRTVCIDYGS
jgi:hypothetical protein